MPAGGWRIGRKGRSYLVFTRQMAALYRKQAWPGRDIVLDMNYTDIGNTYRIVLGESGSVLRRNPPKVLCGFHHAHQHAFECLALDRQREIAGDEALMKHLYSVEGDFDLMMHWTIISAQRAARMAAKWMLANRTPLRAEALLRARTQASENQYAAAFDSLDRLLGCGCNRWLLGKLGQHCGMRLAARSDATDEGDRV